jgi:hypothetical protein
MTDDRQIYRRGPGGFIPENQAAYEFLKTVDEGDLVELKGRRLADPAEYL